MVIRLWKGNPVNATSGTSAWEVGFKFLGPKFEPGRFSLKFINWMLEPKNNLSLNFQAQSRVIVVPLRFYIYLPYFV